MFAAIEAANCCRDPSLAALVVSYGKLTSPSRALPARHVSRRGSLHHGVRHFREVTSDLFEISLDFPG